MKNYTNTTKMQRSQNIAEKQIATWVEKYYNYLGRVYSSNNKVNYDNYKMKYKYYKVTVKCGHVGENWYTLVDFAIRANNGVDAAEKGKKMPRAKHDHADVIRNVEEISEEEFINLYVDNDFNKYLKAKNIQDQRRCDMSGIKIYREKNRPLEKEVYCWDKQYNRKDKVDYIKKKQKIYKNSFRNEMW